MNNTPRKENVQNIISVLLMLLIFVACSDDATMSLDFGKANLSTQVEETRVRLQDVQLLAQAAIPTKTRTENEVSIDFVIDQNDTLFYVINHPGGGWTMYASDRRVPAIVAENPRGSFNLPQMQEASGSWLSCMCEDMRIVRECTDSQLSFTAEEISTNRKFWESISSPDMLLQEQSTRAGGGELLNGHWELYYTGSYHDVYDSVPHLIKTHWKQGHPYNFYCPQKSTGGDNVPAGCVAIAGAQMLFFLHNKLGIPDSTVSQASCTGGINTMQQWGYSSTIWEQMPHDDATNTTNGIYAAPLVAQTGVLVNMQYGDEGSGAYTQDLVNNFFNFYGISCQYLNYNTETLFSNLLNGFPVIANAQTSSSGANGHAFIIDGYKRMCIVTMNIYRWIPDLDGGGIIINSGGSVSPQAYIPNVPDKTEYTYSSITNDYIRMNWGWGQTTGYGPDNLYADDTWFTPTGDWYIHFSSGENLHWNYNRHILCNFSPIE